MSFAEIEAELQKLSADELRRLALKSWAVYAEKEGISSPGTQCNEEDAALLIALDESIATADANPGQGCSGSALRERLREWITK